MLQFWKIQHSTKYVIPCLNIETFPMMLRNILFIFFKFLCIFATAIMVGFWLYKFKQDHDVTLIEYKALEELDEYIHPETTLCFYNAFIPNVNFNITSEKLFSFNYLEYFKGNFKNVEEYNDIEYDQVSVNLNNHLKKIELVWGAGKKPRDYPCKDVSYCPYYNVKNNYNGFSNDGFFLKCFGITINNTYAKDVAIMTLMFNDTLKNAIRSSAVVQVFFNHPNQFTRPRSGPIGVWQKNANDFNNFETVQITSVDLLKRRNKRWDKCTSRWDSFDDLVLKSHIENVGCRAPYISEFINFPICKTQHGMRKSKYFGSSLQKHYLEDPCQEMPNVEFQHSSLKVSIKAYYIVIAYPEKGKIITQLQEVDAHSLIGNIGGYIGLFLGKF